MATLHQMSDAPLIFDRCLLRQRQNRNPAAFADHDFLHRFIIEDIVDRLETVTRKFERAIICGPGAQLLRPALTEKCGVNMLLEGKLADHAAVGAPGHALTLDEEQFPFAPESFDLVISLMSLHMINDVPGTLVKIRQSLKPDGLFIAALPGENTLNELKACLYQAESEIQGGVSPRIVPFAAIRDMGGLLQRAGFTLPVADMLHCPVSYRDPFRLLTDLRNMGETNVLRERKKKTLRRDVLFRTMEIYRERFSNSDGAISASFDILMLTGWAPHPSQQKPLKPGSAEASLADAIRQST